MERKTERTVALISLLLLGILISAFNIQPVKANGYIVIRADGSIDPPTAPIQRDGDNYVFTNNIYDMMLYTERDNIVVDGAGYTIQGTGSGTGILLYGRTNTTIQNTTIKAFDYGIYFYSSSNNSIAGNNIIANTWNGIWLYSSSNNSITGNNIANNYGGVWSDSSSNYNSIAGNNITNNWVGIQFYSSSNNSITGNNIIANNDAGVYLDSSSNSSISRNNITNNWVGIQFYSSSNNSIYHNSFGDNDYGHVSLYESYNNVWDDGYPSGGNYWSDYAGIDEKSGPNQDQPGSDGIGDTPYIIDGSNRDRYSLMSRWLVHDVAVANVVPSKTVVGQDFSLNINVTAANQGESTETFNITVYANTTAIQIKTLTLTSGNSTTLAFTWNTTGFAKGNYTISAYAWPIPGETDIDDNTFIDGIVTVTIPGDVDGDLENGRYDVDLYDAVKLLACYGFKQNESGFDVNCDIDDSGQVFLFDAVILLSHYGQKYP